MMFLFFWMKIFFPQIVSSKGFSAFFNNLNLNPWHYSPEEPRPTEAVAARRQYRGPVVSTALIPQP